MNRRKIFKISKSVVFLFLLIFAMASFFAVFRFKYSDGIYDMDKFYELPKNTVDVLILGTSHAFVNINPAVLFSEYGITSFVLAGSSQPMWNTYFYLCEALKTQRPKVVLLEAYYAIVSKEYFDKGQIIKQTYGMKPSMEYVNALKVSAPKEEFWDYFFRFTRYHSRYTELTREDFLPNKGNNSFIDWKGFLSSTKHNIFEQPIVDGITERYPMTQKTESYYRAIIELCIEKDISLEIIVTPYVVSSNHMQVFNTANDIALEYGITFTNLNNSYDEIGFDFSWDMTDAGHPNNKGSLKISRYVGKKLREKYDISDNRNNQLYATWQRNADYYYRNNLNLYLKDFLDVDAYLEQIVNNQYLVFAYIKDPEIQKKYNFDNNISNLSLLIQGTTIPCFNIGSIDRFKQFGSVMISLDKTGNILVNGNTIKQNDNEINLIIYDPVTDTIADNVSFDFNSSVVIHQ